MTVKRQERLRPRRARRLLVGLLVLGTAAAMTLPAAGHAVVQVVDIQGQGGEGIARANGARLMRLDDGLRVKFRMRPPAPGSYTYPSGDEVPDAHPPVEPGKVEVWTLWLFLFNDPSACTDPCNSDDIGADTPARGGVYQADATIGGGRWLTMTGEVWLGRTPRAGAPLDNPHGVEVHAAMAPHGKRLDGDDFLTQVNNPVGNPSLWWPAIFLP